MLLLVPSSCGLTPQTLPQNLQQNEKEQTKAARTQGNQRPLAGFVTVLCNLVLPPVLSASTRHHVQNNAQTQPQGCTLSHLPLF